VADLHLGRHVAEGGLEEGQEGTEAGRRPLFGDPAAGLLLFAVAVAAADGRGRLLGCAGEA
jgi:hypothetical protein